MKRALFATILLAAAASPAAADTQRITLDEAVEAATTGNFQVAVGKEQILTAEAEVKKTKTYRMPTLGLKANMFVWDSAIEFAGMEVRPQITGQADVTIVAPITTAIILGKLIDLNEAGVDATKAQLDVTKLDLGYQAAEAYLGALQLRTLKEINETSV